MMWLRDAVEVVDTPAVMLFDSCCAVNEVMGRRQPNANIALVEWTRKLLAGVEATGQTVYVKGHSADGGNDRADKLVQWSDRALLRAAGGRWPGPLQSCHDSSAVNGDVGRLGDGADLRIGPGEVEH